MVRVELPRRRRRRGRPRSPARGCRSGRCRHREGRVMADRAADRSAGRSAGRSADQPVGTIVHVLRHGEVYNPEGILYGRRPGYRLSALGRAMAERVAESVRSRDIVHVASSPLERAQETAGPTAKLLGLDVQTDIRLIESTNVFEGTSFGKDDAALSKPKNWWHLRNPFKPSWGEPYDEVVARMQGAILDARAAAHGHEAVLVSHQLPIW